MKILVLITARGGSKRVPGKNIRRLGDKPLVVWSIDAAKGISNICDIIVSTDDVAIAKVCSEAGAFVPWIRPKELSSDTSSSVDVALHALDWYEAHNGKVDGLLLLQPTSPFRTSKHILEAISLYESSDCEMVVSVKKTKSNPYFNLFEEKESGNLELSKKGNFTSRQSAPITYEYNGAIYIFSKETIQTKQFSEFERIKKYEMSAIDSVDLDEPLDWKLAELIFNEKIH